jgi:hypothetical protein
MNQYYSADLSQKVKRGMRENRAKGHYQGGGLPYGYKVVEKKILIDEEKAETVRFIFEQYSLGVIVRDIIKALTSRGVLYKGKPFAKNTIYGILKNKKYSGVYYHGDEKVDNMYPQIVPTHIFESVRAKARQNEGGKSSTKTVYLFRHKMKCGYCGHPISSETGTARNGEVKRYYKCLGRKVYHNGCEQSVHSKEALEEAIVMTIIKEFSKPQTLNGIVKNLANNLNTNRKDLFLDLVKHFIISFVKRNFSLLFIFSACLGFLNNPFCSRFLSVVISLIVILVRYFIIIINFVKIFCIS